MATMAHEVLVDPGVAVDDVAADAKRVKNFYTGPAIDGIVNINPR